MIFFVEALHATAVEKHYNWFSVAFKSCGLGRTFRVRLHSRLRLRLCPRQVWAWGSGKYGYLGLGDSEGRWFPERIEFFAEGRGVAVEMISAGKWHAICLSKKGTVYAWGRNNWGQVHLCVCVY